MKTHRNPVNVHPPLGAYSHQIELSGQERMLVLSGQVGMDEHGQLPEDPYEQLALALENIQRNLAAAGMDMTDLTKLVFYIAGQMDTARRREIIKAKLAEPWPCTTLVYVAGLATPALKVEIDAWASKAV